MKNKSSGSRKLDGREPTSHCQSKVGAVMLNFNSKSKRDFYNSTKWENKREQILKRDGYVCQNCKRFGKKVEATTVHHIKHYDTNPELGLIDSNLVSLCSACHNKAHPEKAKRK